MVVRLNYKSRDLNPSALARSLADKLGLPYSDPIRRQVDAKPFRVGDIPKFSLFDRDASLWRVQSDKRSIAANLIDRHARHIEAIIRRNKEPFKIREMVKIQDGWVGVGSPINVGYEAVPVYVHQNNETRLVFAYRSKSQECWRRFAGFSIYHNIFWKGSQRDGEHLQNFHFDIQNIIDRVYHDAPIVYTLKGGYTKLETFGINAVAKTKDGQAVAHTLILRTEEDIQDSMREGISSLTFAEPGDGIDRLVSFWWSGNSKEGAYGYHLNLVVSNARYYLCIAITDDGLFLKYLQPKNPAGINEVGAPLKAGLLDSEQSWLLTPLLDYSNYAVSAAEKRQIQGAREARSNDTIMFDLQYGARRQRILGLHDDPSSPLFELNAGLYRIYRLMRTERYSDVNRFLQGICSNGHELPLEEHLPMRIVSADSLLFDRRYSQLQHALDFAIDSLLTLPNGQTEIPDNERRRLKQEYDLTEREVSTLLRYAKFMINKMSEFKFGSVEYGCSDYLQEQYQLVWDRVERHLSNMADRWAKDYGEATQPMY
ncbi:MAG: hypothetical protein ABH842_02510 [Candidatus Micrarchaeota archaeon]